MKQLTQQKVTIFQELIWTFYKKNNRHFVWRKIHDPYYIVVSEVMLQQTQTFRVIDKFNQFITELPTFEALAQAPLSTVLSLWQGLGYNRRARYLKKIAKIVVNDYNGTLPQLPDILVKFPGIGPATAASICCFAFNSPVVFIETNVRAVFIHEFFADRDNIHDNELIPLIKQTLDNNDPRQWYYALMDYGVHLKKIHKNPSRKSKHHHKQSQFEGSDRQIRGTIVKLLLKYHQLSTQELLEHFPKRDRLESILQQLEVDHLIFRKKNIISITES